MRTWFTNWRVIVLLAAGLLLSGAVWYLAPRLGARQAVARAQQAGAVGDYGAAMLDMATAAAYLPERADFWEMAGRFAWLNEDPYAAIHYLERARELGSLSMGGQIALGDAWQSAGDLGRALAVWEAALDAGGPAEAILPRMVKVHQQQEDYPALIADYQALTRLQPAEPEFSYRLALLLAATEPQAALAYLAQTADLDADLAENARRLERTIRLARLEDEDPAYLLTAVGRTLGALDEWALAALAFANATQANPQYAEAWAFLGEARQQQGLDGGSALQGAYELDPRSLAVNTLYALYWQRQGQGNRALEHLRQALEVAPDNPILLAGMATTVSALGKVQDALELFQLAVARSPRNPLYWRLLASYSIENEVQVAEVGLPAARRALLLAGEDAPALDLVGTAYMLLEDPVLAERFLRRAQAADPSYARAYLHLGLLYLAQGNTREARRQLEQAVALDPDSAVGRQAVEILDLYVP